MSILDRTPAVRWAVPVAVAALLIGGGAVVGTVTAGAAGTPLPARSAAQLVADVHASEITGLSGTVVQTSDLGIPELPSIGASPLPGGMGSSDLTALISGTHTLRLWYSGPQQIRLALLGSLGESDIIRNGPDLWIWSSTSNTATHRTLPERQPAATHGSSVTGPPGTGLPMSPQHAAALALRAISPSTAVSTGPAVTVAGRAAHELVLRPRDDRSLVTQVRIAIDAAEHVPLRVQVYADGQADPAFQIGCTSIDFSRPDPAQFAFHPPPGATVDEAGRGEHRPPDSSGTAIPRPHAEGAAAAPKVVGSGWTSVLVTGADDDLGAVLPGAGTGRPAEQHPGNPLGRVLAALPRVSGSWGSGRLLRSSLLSAVITDDGRLAVGAVAPDLLYQALGSA
jgi:outer membrane lipoprotein-sorting protein